MKHPCDTMDCLRNADEMDCGVTSVGFEKGKQIKSGATVEDHCESLLLLLALQCFMGWPIGNNHTPFEFPLSCGMVMCSSMTQPVHK